jgi:hypothetical protein
MVKVLRLAGPESFATNRTMDGYNRSVAQGTSRVRVVQNGYAQFLPLPSLARSPSTLASRQDEHLLANPSLVHSLN